MTGAQCDAAFLDHIRKLINGKTVFGVIENSATSSALSAELC